MLNNSYSFINKNINKKEIVNRISKNSFLETSDNLVSLTKTPQNIYRITFSNKDELKKSYSYLFEDKVKDYNFSKPRINDYILDYNDYVVVYNYNRDKIKSAFFFNS